MAKGKLTQNEKYVIEGMFKDKHTADDIAKELGRTKQTIEKYQGEVKDRAKKRKIKSQAKEAKTKEEKVLTAKDLMVHETVVKKDEGVSIMTEGASARGDEEKVGAPSRMSHGAIHKIDGSQDD